MGTERIRLARVSECRRGVGRARRCKHVLDAAILGVYAGVGTEQAT